MVIWQRNRGFLIVFSIYIIALLTDIISTMMVKNKEILETNAAYQYIGFTGIIILNIFVAWMFWWGYTRPYSSPSSRFYLIMCALMIISVRIYALQNAMVFIENPVTIEQAVQIATPEAKLETMKQVAYLAYPPFIFSIIGFIFWKLDHKLERRE